MQAITPAAMSSAGTAATRYGTANRCSNRPRAARSWLTTRLAMPPGAYSTITTKKMPK